MRFYVIYWFDVPNYIAPEDKTEELVWAHSHVTPYTPPKSFHMQLTERDDKSDEYAHVMEAYETCKHRKYVGFLSKEQLRKLCWDMNLWPEDVETMGSITEYGWLPALSFEIDITDHESVMGGAYVTPIPQKPNGDDFKDMNDRAWERVRKAVIAYYRYR